MSNQEKGQYENVGNLLIHCHQEKTLRDKDLMDVIENTHDVQLKLQLEDYFASIEIEKEAKELTGELLDELKRTTFRSGFYGIAQAKLGKKITKTEKEIFVGLPYEVDLEPYSSVLLYSPYFKYMDKNSHKAIVKLIKREYLRIYRVYITKSEKHVCGFTYVMRKIKKEEF